MSNNNRKKKTKRQKKKSILSDIQPIGSPILRINEYSKYRDYDSERWLAWCDKANRNFSLLHKRGIAAGIAAPQLNFPFPSFIWHKGIVCNPSYRIVDDSLVHAPEGCLSVDEGRRTFNSIPRYSAVELEGEDRYGNALEPVVYEGYEARIVQHECDHISGILVIDHLPEEDRTTYLDQEVRAGVV